MSRHGRIRPASAVSLAIALLATAVIVASSAAVLTKDYPPQLAVEVHGVPGYVYYFRDYEVTIEYANTGREVAPSASLSAFIPAGFTLDGVSKATTDAPQQFVWSVGDLAPGQRGEINVTLRGTLPTDLTGAVYDLPGYVGHTAFVDGFKMDVAIAAGGKAVTTFAWADTGASVPPCPNPNTQFSSWVCVRKITDGGDSTGVQFPFDTTGDNTPEFTLQAGAIASVPFTSLGGTVTVRELDTDGWEAYLVDCTIIAGFNYITVVDPPTAAVIWADTQASGVSVCTFYNAPEVVEPEPTPEPSPRPEPTPQVERQQPNIGAGLGGLFTGPPTAIPTAPAVVAPSTSRAISPPNTGDGGLK
jgi:hypothetical protein